MNTVQTGVYITGHVNWVIRCSLQSAVVRDSSHRVLHCNVSEYIVPGCAGTFPMTLPPHELIQVAWNLMFCTASHAF